MITQHQLPIKNIVVVGTTLTFSRKSWCSPDYLNYI